jgi:hypothetical protein
MEARTRGIISDIGALHALAEFFIQAFEVAALMQKPALLYDVQKIGFESHCLMPFVCFAFLAHLR